MALTRPSKKEFAQLINEVTGTQQMTEQKLDRILVQAKQAYQQAGTAGFFSYMREVIQAPISNDTMQQLIKKTQDPKFADQILKQMRSPSSKKKG